MTSTRYKLGELVEQLDDRNSDGTYGIDDVRGISIQKVFIDTKANMKGVPLKPYKLVRPDSFAYVTVTSRNGEKITLAHNTTEDTYIVSTSYIVFKVSDEATLLPDYLYIYFNRPEFDRFARFSSWGSARETFTWEDMCDIDIDLPPIEIQKKYVDIYKSMVENQKCYERGLEDLKLTCDACIEELRRKEPLSEIGLHCSLKKAIRNIEEKCRNVKGIKVTKEFAETKADINDTTPLHNYKIVNPNEIVYVPNTARMGDKFACALADEICCVSPIYEIINVDHPDKLLPEYLFMWFTRPEFDRYARFNSWGSVREILEWDVLKEYSIPIVNIATQHSIVNLHKTYENRQKINNHMKSTIKDICSVLIKGSIEDAKK